MSKGLAGLLIRLDIDNIKPLFVRLFAEIHPFQAAGIDHGRVFIQDLPFVNVPQGNVVEGGISNITYHNKWLLSNRHQSFRTAPHLRITNQNMSSQNGRQFRVELLSQVSNGIGQHLLQLLVNLLQGQVFGFFPFHQGAPSQPGQRGNLNNTVFGFNKGDFGAVGDVNILDSQGMKNLGAGSLTDGVGQVVVTDQNKDGDTAAGEPVDAQGELALLGLARLPALIGVPAEDDQVHPGLP